MDKKFKTDKYSTIQNPRIQRISKENTNSDQKRTELGEEEEEHNDGGGEGDDAAGEGTAVEVFVDFGIGVQIPELVHHILHGLCYTLRIELAILLFSI